MKFVTALLLLSLCAPARAESFLILPFFNLSKANNLDWIGESVADSITNALASHGILALDREARQEGYRRLTIKPRSQITKASVIRLAESLDASQVVFGTYELLEPTTNGSNSRGTLRIVANVINLAKITKGPEFVEAAPLEQLAALQNQLAFKTLQSLLPDNKLSESEFQASRPVVRVEAIESYIRGLLSTSPDQKMSLFSQAARLEPQYSPANFRLGELYLRKNNYKQAAEAFQKVAPVDPSHREATFLLGICRYHLGDFNAAEQAFRAVSISVPLNEVWNNLGAALSRKNAPEALDAFQRALEGDANDPDYHFNVGYALYKRGDMEGAAKRFREVLDRTPEDTEAITMLGRALRSASTPGNEIHPEPVERLKRRYEESAYLQLKAVLESKKAKTSN
jgi:tetratricopeptide (TPR) repeat protein